MRLKPKIKKKKKTVMRVTKQIKKQRHHFADKVCTVKLWFFQ